MSRSSIAMGYSWLFCKSAFLALSLTPWMRRATLGRPLWKKCVTCPHFYKEPSSGSLVSLRAAMSILYMASSHPMNAVRRRAPSPVSCRVRIFQLAITSGRCFIDKFTLYVFGTHVGKPCGCGRPPGKGVTGNVWATFSRSLLQWRWAAWILKRAAQSSWQLLKRDAVSFPSLSDHLIKAAVVLKMPPSFIAPTTKGIVHKIVEEKLNVKRKNPCAKEV